MKKERAFCAVVIVTYDSERFITKAMHALKDQTRAADQIVIVDSGSKDPSYLTPLARDAKVLLGGQDIGFCAANNLGVLEVDLRTDYVLFLNPDTFLSPIFLEKALDFMEQRVECAALTGITYGYDIDRDEPTGLYDSTGIFRTWYGRWFDRAQNERVVKGRFSKAESVPAICGALLLCRKSMLPSKVFDPKLFMYKEDVDLCLRLRKEGHTLFFVPDLSAYHCRGWKSRNRMARRWRLLSARNGLIVAWRERSFVALIYRFLQYVVVKVLNV